MAIPIYDIDLLIPYSPMYLHTIIFWSTRALVETATTRQDDQNLIQATRSTQNEIQNITTIKIFALYINTYIRH